MKPDPNAMDGDWTLLIADQDLSDHDRPYTLRDGQIWQAPHPDPIGTYEFVGSEVHFIFPGTEGCTPERPGKLRTWTQVPISAETVALMAFPIVETDGEQVPANDDENFDEDEDDEVQEARWEATFGTWGGNHFRLLREGEVTAMLRSELRAQLARAGMHAVAAE